MAEEKDVQQGTEGEEKKSNKVMLWAIIVGMILLNGVMAFLLVRLTMKQMNPVAQENIVDSTMIVEDRSTSVGAVSETPVEAIVNIQGTDGLRFLKVSVVFGYDSDKYKKLGEELTRRHAELKNLMIDLLAGMSLEDLEADNARDRIRNDLLRRVNTLLPEKEAGQISKVYLNEFIIQ
jgi:flagellar basal body-associated protein FliL